MGFMLGPRRSVWGAPHQKALILAAWLGVWVQLTSGQGSGADVFTAAVGQTATLNAPVTTGVFSFNWYRGTVANDTLRIITYVPSSGAQSFGPQATRRESILANGSLQIRELRTSDSGDYTGSATLTDGIIKTGAPQQLKVYGTDPTLPPDNIGGLSTGAIVGIVIGVLAAIIIVCALVYIFVIKKPASGGLPSGDSTEMTANNNDGSASSKANGAAAAEVQYSSVNFVPKKGTPAKPIAPENTVYSEVRR